MPRLRVVFMGTPQFAVPALERLLASPHEVVCVYCQPPRRAGRGQKARPCPVEEAARTRGIPVRAPTSLKDPEEQKRFAELGADAAVVAAYGLLLPPAILKAPRLGCLNIHPSLLPRWRGAAPIPRAILAGDTETGVVIMTMDEGLDTGAVVLMERVVLAPDATAGELGAELAKIGARLMLAALEGLDARTMTPKPQPRTGVTYAAKLQPGEERLDWREDAAVLARKVRAFAPAPGTWFDLNGERIRVLAARQEEAPRQAPPGTVLDDALSVACGRGALRLMAVQRAGRAAMPASAFLRGRKVAAGAMLSSPD
jgi:methionyl-tRNA formyltransferase